MDNRISTNNPQAPRQSLTKTRSRRQYGGVTRHYLCPLLCPLQPFFFFGQISALTTASQFSALLPTFSGTTYSKPTGQDTSIFRTRFIRQSQSAILLLDPTLVTKKILVFPNSLISTPQQQAPLYLGHANDWWDSGVPRVLSAGANAVVSLLTEPLSCGFSQSSLRPDTEQPCRLELQALEPRPDCPSQAVSCLRQSSTHHHDVAHSGLRLFKSASGPQLGMSSCLC